MKAKELVQLIVKACEDKKAEDIAVLDIRKMSAISDYFVICTGNSDPHVRAIADNVLDQLEAHKQKCFHKEGLQESKWVLLDFSDVIVHVFYHETRKFYNLERLWGEAAKFQETKSKSKSKAKPKTPRKKKA